MSERKFILGRRELLCAGMAMAASRPAFAQGVATDMPMGWTQTTGGRGGPVLRVTSLDSDGPGSLRAALTASGPRTVVFEVAGVIDLKGRTLMIDEPFLTIDGQTAPDPGITIIRGGIAVKTHDVIVRHIRVRPGSDGRPLNSGWDVDGLSCIAAYDVIIDQCSFSWATDENLSVSGPRFDGGDTPEGWRKHTSRRITLSRNIVAEGLSHSTHSKGEHSKGSLAHDNATDILFVGNLYAHNFERNQLFKGGVHAASVNNLIYDPGNRCMNYAQLPKEWGDQPREPGRLSIVGNVVKGGPSTPIKMPFFLVQGDGVLEVFMADNVATHANGNPMTEVANAPDAKPTVRRLPAPAVWPNGLRARAASEVTAWVTTEAGARPWNRDEVDRRILQQVASGSGRIIDREIDVGGYPS